MNIIGNVIKTHDNKFVGTVKTIEPIFLGEEARKKNGVFGKPYVAYVAELEETDSFTGFSTLIAETDEGIEARYLVAA
jgi:hypothetical protein